MIETVPAQLRYVCTLAFGSRLHTRSLDRLVTALLDAREEFGAVGRDAAEALRGPELDETTRREVQVRRFRKQAQLAARTPYYSRLFAELGIEPRKLRWDGLEALPTTPKEALKADPDAFVPAAARPAFRALTTGTTEIPATGLRRRADRARRRGLDAGAPRPGGAPLLRGRGRRAVRGDGALRDRSADLPERPPALPRSAGPRRGAEPRRQARRRAGRARHPRRHALRALPDDHRRPPLRHHRRRAPPGRAADVRAEHDPRDEPRPRQARALDSALGRLDVPPRRGGGARGARGGAAAGTLRDARRRRRRRRGRGRRTRGRHPHAPSHRHSPRAPRAAARPARRHGSR